MTDNDETLKGLYPFLHGEAQDAASLDDALLDSARAKARESIAIKTRFFDQSADQLVAAAHTVAQVYQGGGKLFTMGNGGSSCDAAHLAVEFQHPVTAGRPALPAMNLCMDAAMNTAVGNDVGFEHIFRRQIIAHGRAGDGLIGFSTSGNSDNLMQAFAKAHEMGLSTIAFAGGDGGAMGSSDVVMHCLIMPTDSIHRVQECHLLCYHILWDLVHTILADSRGSAGE